MTKLNYSLIPADRSDEVAELLLNSFFREEPLGLALGSCMHFPFIFINPAHIQVISLTINYFRPNDSIPKNSVSLTESGKKD